MKSGNELMSRLTADSKNNLPVQILMGLILGILVGLFFGEMTVWLQSIGRVF